MPPPADKPSSALRPAHGAAERAANGKGPVEIRVEHLFKTFGKHKVLHDVNLEVRFGEILAIVGGSGSGKTVLLDHMVGLLSPDSGGVLAADHDAPPSAQPPLIDLTMADEETLDRIRLRWSVVFQRNALFSGTVRDNVALWLREHTSLPERDIQDRILRSVRAAALDPREDVLDKDRDALSGGMAKRVAIAPPTDPLVIFYDEPTTGLDPVISGQIHELIWKTHHLPVGGDPDKVPPGADGRGERTSIIVTHDKDLLRRLRPRVVMLHHTQVCFDGPYDQFERSESGPAAEYLRAMPVLQARDVE